MNKKISGAVKAIGLSLTLLFAPVLCSPLVVTLQEWLQTAPRGTVPGSLYWFLECSKFSFVVMGGFFIPIAAFGLIYSLVQRKKHEAAVWFGLGVMCLVAWTAPPSHKTLWPGRRQALVRIAANAKPVTVALEKYREDHGKYPEKLKDLVPSYLPSTPVPDALGCREYRYRLAGSSSRFQKYELQLELTIGFMQWDCFVYWPERKYPAQMYSGRVERIEDWAYVHE